MVVIELKTGEFKTSYLGQLMGYLTLLDEKVRKRHENPSIGIVLCKSANREYVEFMIRDYSKPMGVATYKTADEMPENCEKSPARHRRTEKVDIKIIVGFTYRVYEPPHEIIVNLHP